MWPFSSTQDKLVLPVAGRPLIAPLLETLEELDYSRIYVVVSRRGQQQLMTALKKDAAALDLQRLHFVEDTQAGGCAASLGRLLTLLPADTADTDELLVCYGDVVTPAANLKRTLKEHHTQKPAVSVLVQSLRDAAADRIEEPGDWICAQVQNGSVQRILGHPRSGVTHRLGGVFVFNKAARDAVAHTAPYMEAIQVGMMPPAEAILAQTVANLLADGHKIRAVDAEEYLVDVDKPWHLLEANYRRLDYLAKKQSLIPTTPKASLSPRADVDGAVFCGQNVTIGPRVTIQGTVWLGDNTIVDNGAIIKGPAWIGNNCVLEDYCLISPYTSIGANCRVGHCAEVEGILMEGVYAVHYMEFYGIIGRSSDLGAATVCGSLRFDDGRTAISVLGRQERPFRFSNAVYLGDFTRTGVNAVLMPGVRVGPYSVIGSGVVLNEDVADGTMVFVEQNLSKRSWGPEKYGW